LIDAEERISIENEGDEELAGRVPRHRTVFRLCTYS
jgi:hypothetical protein